MDCGRPRRRGVRPGGRYAQGLLGNTLNTVTNTVTNTVNNVTGGATGGLTDGPNGATGGLQALNAYDLNRVIGIDVGRNGMPVLYKLQAALLPRLVTKEDGSI